MKTIDIKFFDLCNEIDYWKEKTHKAEKEAEYWRNEYSKHLNEQLLSSQKATANALMFALYAHDDGNGNLVIDSEDREMLSERYK